MGQALDIKHDAPKRIVYTIALGKPKFAECALGLGRSLRLIGDTTRRVVITDMPSYPWDRCFDEVLTPKDPLEWVFYTKLTALERTDADQILFIDGDTLAFKRLGPIFDYCAGKGFAVQGKQIRTGYWYGQVEEHLTRHQIDTLPQFNGGMIYYERSSAVSDFIEVVRGNGRKSTELGFIYDSPIVIDEPNISLAMAQTGFGHLIPDEMDFSNSATGLVGSLNMDVRSGTCKFICRRYDVRLVEPYLFHASRYINFLIYWRQLDRLKQLDRYELTHSAGYMSPLHKLARSVQRRVLKLAGRL